MREFHTFENEIQTLTTQFLLSMRTLAKVSFSNFSQPTFSSVWAVSTSRLGLLTFTNASEALKGYSEFCLNIEKDRHFRWTSFQKPWDWKFYWQDVNVLSNGLIQARLGSVVLTASTAS